MTQAGLELLILLPVSPGDGIMGMSGAMFLIFCHFFSSRSRSVSLLMKLL